ncbi:universal stress protein [Xanthobacter sp. AM11]|uniref:universal stress protein n=1 Tax=Xanthobacter sp. AM11 TaxID=3380643 RepID=UPI0039BFFF55
MMKSALLLLGESPSSIAAGAYARRLAGTLGVRLIGLAGIDLAFIEAPMPGAIGGAAYHAQMETGLRAQAETLRERLDAAFHRDCAAAGIVPECLSFAGDPFEQVTTASAGCDLVIAGHDVTFRGLVSEAHSDTLAQLLAATPRPILVCPEAIGPEGDVLLAYDGSLPSMRALQLFVLCGGWADRRVRVLSVDTALDAAERLARDAAAYLRLHGYAVEPCPVQSSESPAGVIQAQAAGEGVELLVMGAYGHRGLKEFLFGSTTQNIIGAPQSCIFIYH